MVEWFVNNKTPQHLPRWICSFVDEILPPGDSPGSIRVSGADLHYPNQILPEFQKIIAHANAFYVDKTARLRLQRQRQSRLSTAKSLYTIGICKKNHQDTLKTRAGLGRWSFLLPWQ